MSVLAQEANVLSKGFTALVQNVISGLESVSGWAGDLNAKFDCRRNEVDDPKSASSLAMNDDLSAVIEGIVELDDRFESSSLAIRDSGPTSVRRPRDRRKAGLFDRVDDGSGDCQNALKYTVDSIQSWVPPDLQIDPTLVSMHSSRYTMESERAVHQLVCERGGSAVASDSSCETTNTGLAFEDDLGSNVELF